MRDDSCASSGFSCSGSTVTDPEGQIVNQQGQVIGQTTPPHTCGVGSCDPSAWGDSEGFAERHHIWDDNTNKRWDAMWAPARAALAAKEAAEAKYRTLQAAHDAQQAALAAQAHKHWWNDWHTFAMDAAQVTGDISTAAGYLTWVPGIGEYAGAISIGAGLISSGLYLSAGDEKDSVNALGVVALGILAGGVGSKFPGLGKLIDSRYTSPLAKIGELATPRGAVVAANAARAWGSARTARGILRTGQVMFAGGSMGVNAVINGFPENADVSYSSDPTKSSGPFQGGAFGMIASALEG